MPQTKTQDRKLQKSRTALERKAGQIEDILLRKPQKLDTVPKVIKSWNNFRNKVRQTKARRLQKPQMTLKAKFTGLPHMC